MHYVEGYVDTGTTIPVDHAWISVNGKVVDPTIRLDDQSRVLGVIPKGWAYYGVELDPTECEHHLVHQAAVPLIDDWECNWRLIDNHPAHARMQHR